MATVTEYLERSMQKCSLSNRRRCTTGDELGITDEHIPISDTFLELNSHISIPSHWQKCFDLKTGEVYYRNWNNGMKVKEDPRKSNNPDQFNGESYGSVFSEKDSSYYESEESSSREDHKEEEEEEDVLVVAGCNACFMYFMVPKLLEGCPKCASQLLHFDQPHYASP